MAERASYWGPEFERVGVRSGVGRELTPIGILEASDGLEELPPSASSFSNLRAFLVRGSSYDVEGFRRGDHLLVDATPHPSPNALVLVRVEGRYVLQHGSRLTGLPIAAEILGALVGLIRRRGLSPRRSRLPQDERDSSARSGVLHAQLRMLEITRAATRNPRLQRALHDEEDRIRRQLQFGAGWNKLC